MIDTYPSNYGSTATVLGFLPMVWRRSREICRIYPD